MRGSVVSAAGLQSTSSWGKRTHLSRRVGGFVLRSSPSLFFFGPSAKQHRPEVHYVVGQRAPQRHALDFVEPSHRKRRQAAITSQVGIHGFARRGPFFVNLF